LLSCVFLVQHCSLFTSFSRSLSVFSAAHVSDWQNVNLGTGSGNDIKMMNESSVTDCCTACQGNSKCRAFAYHPDTKGCWLHSAALPYVEQSNTISGVPSGAVPPPPPPPPPAAGPVVPIPRACEPPHDKLPFCDPNLKGGMSARVDDLISRLTLDEKPYLLVARESPKGNISRSVATVLCVRNLLHCCPLRALRIPP
jgi:hypothetical protein